MSKKDYYDVLGVSKTATADEIKKAEKNLNTEITRRKTHIAKLKIKAKDKANMIFGDLYAKGNLK